MCNGSRTYDMTVDYVRGSNKSWLVAVTLSALLGTLGIDRCYMGHYWAGVLKAVTVGGFGIWSVIDCMLIAADVFRPAGEVW